MPPEDPTIYEFYDATDVALGPARWAAATARLVFANPYSPLSYTLPARAIAASADVFTGVTKRRGKPAWKLPVAPEVVDDRPFCRLVRFTAAPERDLPRVLLVAPLSGHYATLLRGTVAAMLDGHDVYVTDWVDARDVPLDAGTFDLDTYLEYMLGHLRMLGPDVHVIAVCQPAPLVLAAVALLAAANDPAQPRSMTLMGGPVDVRVAPTAPTELAEQYSLDWFSRTLTTTVPARYAGGGRHVYPGFVQLGAFLSMNPQRHLDAAAEVFAGLITGDGDTVAARRAFYDEYLSVMDIPAEYYLQTVDEVFQRATLAQGTMTWRGQRVQPSAIHNTALLTVEGELDDISAPGQTYAAQTLCSSLRDDQRDHLLEPGVGHYGIFNGRRWRTDIAPRIARFIAAHAA